MFLQNPGKGLQRVLLILPHGVDVQLYRTSTWGVRNSFQEMQGARAATGPCLILARMLLKAFKSSCGESTPPQK